MRPIARHQARLGAPRGQAFRDARVRALAVLALAAGLSLALGSSAQPGSSEIGRGLVLRNCGMCHAVGRTDTSPNPVAPAFRDLHLRYSVDGLAEALTEGVLTGHPQMPAFRFSAEEVADIIQYLNSIQTLQPAKIDRATPRSIAAFAASDPRNRRHAPNPGSSNGR